LTLKECKRGEVYLPDLDPVIGSEQGKRRPVVIVQNDVGNKYSPTTIIAAITSKVLKKAYPTEVRVQAGLGGLQKESAILLSQIKTVDKIRLEKHLGQFDEDIMEEIDNALKISLSLIPI